MSDLSSIVYLVHEALSVRDKNGRVVLQGALIATVYFEDPYTIEKRQAVVSCCQRYAKACGEHLRWAMDTDAGRMKPFATSNGATPGAWLPSLTEKDLYEIIWTSAEDARGAGVFSLHALGQERRSYTHLGYLRISVPISWLADAPGALAGMVRAICDDLKPTSGYGGISVNESWDTSISSKYEPYVYRWAQRFPGLEVDYTSSHSIWLRKGREGSRPGVKGADWLTIIGDRFLAEMGGRDAFCAGLTALDARFSVVTYDGGLIIQAGPRPDLGDVERGAWPELYVKLSKYLKPIRISQHRPFQYEGPGERFDLARSEAWLRRFDDR